MQAEDDITKVQRVSELKMPKCPLCRHTLRLGVRVAIEPTGKDYYVETWDCVKCDYSEMVEVISGPEEL